eukprot:Lankesteria_metandrocarpae@DN4778_c0_g1_i4.p1
MCMCVSGGFCQLLHLCICYLHMRGVTGVGVSETFLSDATETLIEQMTAHDLHEAPLQLTVHQETTRLKELIGFLECHLPSEVKNAELEDILSEKPSKNEFHLSESTRQMLLWLLSESGALCNSDEQKRDSVMRNAATTASME